MTDVPDGQVSAFANIQCAAIVQKTERTSGMPGCSCQTLFRRQAEQSGCQHHRRSQ